MDLNCFNDLDADVNTWVEFWRQRLQAVGVVVVEGFDKSGHDSPSIKIFPEDFVKICSVLAQKVVFLYRVPCDVDQLINLLLAEEIGGDEDFEFLVQAFKDENRFKVDRAKLQCPAYRETLHK